MRKTTMNKIFGFAAVAFLSLMLLAGPSFAMGSADRDQGPAERAGESIDEAGRATRDAVTPKENEGVDLDVQGDPITPRENEGVDLDVHTENEGRANQMLLADSGKGKYGSDEYDKDYDKSRKDHDKYNKDYDKSRKDYDKSKDYDKYDKDYGKSKDYDEHRSYDKSDSYDREHYNSDKSY
jgi:hypothetical protein